MEVAVLNIQGKETGRKITLSEAVTGTARAGSVKSPVFVGGGRIFGPRPKDYTQKLNKKVKRLARRSILSQKAKDGAIIVLENFNFEAPKTKEFTNILSNLGIQDKKVLFVLSDINKNVYLSSRNLPSVNTITASELNTYNVANATSVVLLEGAVEVIESILTK